MSTRRISSLFKQKLKKRLADLEAFDFSSAGVEYFAGAEDVANPLFLEDGFDPIEAWWMVHLCYLVYTPDSKEFRRIWNAGKQNRLDVLDERTPFHELLDVHKTGNSAAIYEMGGEGTVLCFRGTCKAAQWISNLVYRPHGWERFREPDGSPGAYVHSGFYLAFKRIWPLLWPTLRLAPRPWIFTGHSLGGALAMLANAAVKADKTYTFGAPRVGNETFANDYLRNTIRVVNDQDIVPLLPARDKSMGEKVFDHGGELVWLTEDGAIHEDPHIHTKLKLRTHLEDWTRESDEILKKTPPWIRDHLIGKYCRKIEKLI